MRRVYKPTSGRRDVDQFEQVLKFRAFGWSLVGAFLGFLLGMFLGVQGKAGAGVVLLTTFIGWATSYFGPLTILHFAAQAGSSLYNPSGKSTPHKREYSLAESHAVRGEFQEAVDAFTAAIAEDPTDPIPYLRVARIQRDQLKDNEAAARWFKSALDESQMHSGLRTLTRKELVELYEVRMSQPRRAAPLLARIAEERAGTPEGDAASKELTRIKAMLASERHDG